MDCSCSLCALSCPSRDAQNKTHRATLLVAHEDVPVSAEAVQDIAAAFVGHTLTRYPTRMQKAIRTQCMIVWRGLHLQAAKMRLWAASLWV